MKEKLSIIAIALMMMLGMGLILYPVISNRLAMHNQIESIQNMEKRVNELDEEECRKEKAKAEEYNQALRGENITDPYILGSGMVLPDNYNEIMDFGDGVMAELVIPCIDVDLPIYHGTDDEILKKGIGHLYQSAFPIGGEDSHVVLSGHTGLPSAKLLTDLDQMKTGDCFYIKVFNDTLAYEVDQILVTEPNETSALCSVKGKDYVTLVTCTPYGINSQRLLVRGKRIPYSEGQEENGDVRNVIGLKAVSWWLVGGIIAAVVFVIVALWVLVLRKDRRNK